MRIYYPCPHCFSLIAMPRSLASSFSPILPLWLTISISLITLEINCNLSRSFQLSGQRKRETAIKPSSISVLLVSIGLRTRTSVGRVWLQQFQSWNNSGKIGFDSTNLRTEIQIIVSCTARATPTSTSALPPFVCSCQQGNITNRCVHNRTWLDLLSGNPFAPFPNKISPHGTRPGQ